MTKVDLRHPTIHQGRELQQRSRLLRALVDELTSLRTNAGLSQAQVAERIGTSQRTLSQLESLTHEPKIGTLLAWAEAVGLRLSWHAEGDHHAEGDQAEGGPVSQDPT